MGRVSKKAGTSRQESQPNQSGVLLALKDSVHNRISSVFTAILTRPQSLQRSEHPSLGQHAQGDLA